MAKALVIKGADFEDNRVATVVFEGAHTTAVSLDANSLDFSAVGTTQALVCTLTPSDSVDPVVWSTSNSSVATVANGVVTAAGIGTCTITATSGSYSDSCTISVEVYLTGVKTANTLVEASASGNNHFTKMTCNVGQTSFHDYEQYMTMTDSSQTVPESYMCANMCRNTAESGSYNYEVMQPNEMSSGTSQYRIYQAIGYPIPMQLPSGCTKIKCTQLSNQYAAYPLFFRSDTRAHTTNLDVNGAQYYCAYRDSQYKAADFSWTYEAETEFDVPTGYDSVVVSWRANPNDATAVLPINFTSEQKDTFKVQCL